MQNKNTQADEEVREREVDEISAGNYLQEKKQEAESVKDLAGEEVQVDAELEPLPRVFLAVGPSVPDSEFDRLQGIKNQETGSDRPEVFVGVEQREHDRKSDEDPENESFFFLVEDSVNRYEASNREFLFRTFEFLVAVARGIGRFLALRMLLGILVSEIVDSLYGVKVS